jgi:hypothetical protein
MRSRRTLAGSSDRVLRDEPAAEGALEDGAAKRGTPALRPLDRRAAAYGFCGVLFDDCLGVTSAPCDFGTTTGPFIFEPLYPPRFSLAFELLIASPPPRRALP